jgi:hypothetical protein
MAKAGPSERRRLLPVVRSGSRCQLDPGPDLKRLGGRGRGKLGSAVTERVRFLDFPAADVDGGRETLAAVLGLPHGVTCALDDEQRDLPEAPAAVRAARQYGLRSVRPRR